MLAGMRRIAGALLLAAVGCGGDPPRDALSGTDWDLIHADGCVTGISFADDGGYAHLYACELTNGQIGTTADVGRYGLGGGTLSLAVAKATCPATTPHAVTASATIQGGTLVISDSSSTTIFERNRSTGGSSGSLVYGCFDDAGNFTPSPLASF